jgi:hypothetical protein
MPTWSDHGKALGDQPPSVVAGDLRLLAHVVLQAGQGVPANVEVLPDGG